MKFLFIDDNEHYCCSLRVCFAKKSNVEVRTCTSVEAALAAVAECKPDVVFLDHQLTEDGSEGFEIASQIHDGVKVFSTTADKEAAKMYKDLGIQHVPKTDLAAFFAIINQKEE